GLHARRQAHPVGQLRPDGAAVGCRERQGGVPILRPHQLGLGCGRLVGRQTRPVRQPGQDRAAVDGAEMNSGPLEEKYMTSQHAVVSRRTFLRLVAAAAAFSPGFLRADDDKPPDLLIGYTEFRTDLPGGRYVNNRTRRAVVAKADGTGRRVLAKELMREPG